MCSNETLKVSLDGLQSVVKENTAEQKETRKEHQETRSALDRLSTKFETWQETKCGEHESKIYKLEKKVDRTDAKINKGGGALAAIMIFLQMSGLWLAWKKLGGP